MTRADMRAYLMDRMRFFNDRDISRLVAGHAPDGEIISPMFGTVRGRTDIEAQYRKLFQVFEDMRFDGESEPIIDGDRAVQPFVARASHTYEMFGLPATGRRFELHGALFLDFVDDLIARERRLYDFTAMLLQLGALKPKVTV
jgi:predicted ester cyclase